MPESITDDQITIAHREYLASQAIDVDLALRLGVRSLTSKEHVAELPEPFDSWANFPAILFPWTNPDGLVEYQIRPDTPTEDARGRPRKYVFRRDMTPVLWAVRPAEPATRIVIVEGTKQALAAASYAPAGSAIYGIAGCRNWQKDGIPIPDLAVADGLDVVILLDADAAGNPDVYAAGMGLAEALLLEGAAKVSFARLPAAGKSGLDDVLATRPEDRRAKYLAQIIDSSKSKPADKVPTGRRKGPRDEGNPDRPLVVCNRDRRDVINDLAQAMLNRWDGTKLFNHGGVISRLGATGMAPLDRGTALDTIQDTARTVNENEGANGITRSFTWPDPGTIAAVLSRAEKFSPLETVARSPFVRPDGTIVTAPGYDEATRTMLLPDESLEGLEVPEEPTAEQVAAARDLLMTEWLGDFPFEGDADRANVLGLIVTPAIRGLVRQTPLAVVDGLQMGVGKNLLADSILTVYTGEPARPLNFVDDREEMRKQLTAAFRTGAQFFVFDEAHTIEGAALAQALTAQTWQDRILGVSNMAEFPNRVTWMSLGNNVQVRGDLTRRVYRIALRPTYSNPQDRDSSTFRHPDLGSWTRAHRRDLLTAILTLVRAWFVAGQPYPSRGISFGSFEVWERYVGGIVELAGLPGFLSNLTVWRSESDFDTQYWQGHLGWLAEQFEDHPFKTSDVRATALRDPAAYMAPPKLDDPADKGYGKALGEAYSRLRGRRYGGLWIEREGWAHGHVSLWRVYREEEASSSPPLPPVPPEPEPTEPAPDLTDAQMDAEVGRLEDMLAGLTEPAAEVEQESEGLTFGGELAELLTFDLECGDADALHSSSGPGYIHLTGLATDDAPVQIETDAAGAELAAQAIDWAKVTTGHNIMAFDLPALVRAGVLTMERVHALAKDGRLFDGLLAARHLDPPMARDKGVDATRKYDLDSLAERLGLGRKDDAAKALAKKYGSWDAIPYDTESEDGRAFRAYLQQDVNLSRMVHAELLERLGGSVPPYLHREHRVAAIGAQIAYNGFRVDMPALQKRVAEVNERKAGSLAWLEQHAGVSLVDGKGNPYKSPLGSKAGKEALEAAFRAAGATSVWHTARSGQFDISGDHMLHLAREYHHLPQVREIAKNVYRVVGARSVYETALNCTHPDGRVHPKIGFDQATGRWSLTQPGLTVFGKRGGRHVERMIFLPDEGEVVLAVDLSQVDMRAVAGLSQDLAYIEMLKHEDPHAEIAKMLFGDVKFRENAKAIGHGWNYGRGIKAISDGQEIDPALVRQFDRSMRERFGRLVEWQDEVRALAESGLLLDNGFGRPMRADPQRAYTQGPALMGQGAARDIMMTGLLNVADRYPEVLPMLRAQVHDEIVCSVPSDCVEDVRRAIIDAFTWEWRGVPILADSSPAASTWGGCYDSK